MKLLFGLNIKTNKYNNQDIIKVKQISEYTFNLINKYNKQIKKSNYKTKGIPLYLLILTIILSLTFIGSLIILIDRLISNNFDINYHSYLIYIIIISFIFLAISLIFDYSKYKQFKIDTNDIIKIKDKINKQIIQELNTPSNYELIDILIPSFIQENDDQILKTNKTNTLEEYKIYVIDNILYLQNDYQLLNIELKDISIDRFITIKYNLNSPFNKKGLNENQIRKYKIIIDSLNNSFQTTGYYKFTFKKEDQKYCFYIPYYEENVISKIFKI